MKPRPKIGDIVTLNKTGDLMFEHEARQFIGTRSVVLKNTKAGLVLIALCENPKIIYSASLRNVDIISAG